MVKRYNPHSEIDISARLVEDEFGIAVHVVDYEALAAELAKSEEDCRQLSVTMNAGARGHRDALARIRALEAALRPLSDMCYRGPLWDAARACFPEETVCESCEGSGESGVTHHDGTQYSIKTPPCAECGGSGLTMQPGMPDGEPEGLPCPKCKP